MSCIQISDNSLWLVMPRGDRNDFYLHRANCGIRVFSMTHFVAHQEQEWLVSCQPVLSSHWRLILRPAECHDRLHACYLWGKCYINLLSWLKARQRHSCVMINVSNYASGFLHDDCCGPQLTQMCSACLTVEIMYSLVNDALLNINI